MVHASDSSIDGIVRRFMQQYERTSSEDVRESLIEPANMKSVEDVLLSIPLEVGEAHEKKTKMQSEKRSC